MADNSELMTDLKPCPFCGSDKIAVSHTNLGYEVLCYYYGSGCKSRTGIWPTRIEAIEAWNRRTPVMAEAGAVSEAEVSAAADALQLAFEPGGKDVPYEVAARAALLAARRCARCWEGRTMADVKKLAIDLLASLDPEDLNPEQFNAWSALSAELPTVTAEAGEVSEAEVDAAVAAFLDACGDHGSMEWLALQNGRIEIEGRFPKDAVFRAALLATRRVQPRQDAPSPDVAGLIEAAGALVTAVRFADPPKFFNGVECHEARVPIEFIQNVEAALSRFTPPKQDDWQREAFAKTVALAESNGMFGAGDLGLPHLKDMLRTIQADNNPQHPGEGFSQAKVGRWLGWAQAAVVAADCATLNDMKEINITASRAAKRKQDAPSPDVAGLIEALHTLAMLVLQSSLYRSDMDVRDAVDVGLALSRLTPPKQDEKCRDCGGCGFVPNPHARYSEDYAAGRPTGVYSTNDPEEIDCPGCGGSGFVAPKQEVSQQPTSSDEEPF